MDTVKKIFTAAKNKIVGFVKKLIEKIVELGKKAKEIIKRGIVEALEYFELDVRAQVNTTIRFKV